MGVKFFFIIDRNRRHFLLANKCYLVDPFFLLFLKTIWTFYHFLCYYFCGTYLVYWLLLLVWCHNWYKNVTVNKLFNINVYNEKGMRCTNKTRYGRYSAHKNRSTIWTLFEQYVNTIWTVCEHFVNSMWTLCKRVYYVNTISANNYSYTFYF